MFEFQIDLMRSEALERSLLAEIVPGSKINLRLYRLPERAAVQEVREYGVFRAAGFHQPCWFCRIDLCARVFRGGQRRIAGRIRAAFTALKTKTFRVPSKITRGPPRCFTRDGSRNASHFRTRDQHVNT